MSAAVIAAVILVVAPAVIVVGVLFLLDCVAEALRGPADIAPGGEPAGDAAEPDSECLWCRKPRGYSNILPKDCKCDKACGVIWCPHVPVTA